MHEDFGEKIGGAKKDLWKDRGLYADDLEAMNEREAEKFVKKDNVWKKPDYAAMLEEGIPLGVVYFIKKARDGLNASPQYYRTDDTPEKRTARQKEYIKTVRELQAVLSDVRTVEDTVRAYDRFFVDNGYLEKVQGWGSGIHYRATKKGQDNPVITNKLSNTMLIRSAEYFERNFTQKAKKEQFCVSKEQKIPKGYAIHFNDGKHTYSKNEDWKPGTYYVTKGYSILRTNFETKEAALKWVQELAKGRNKNGKIRFVPPQLAHVKRTGPDYRNGVEITGQHYLDTFGFRGGEFGNWMNQNDRQTSLNMGFEALKDLASALKISDKDIAYQGTLKKLSLLLALTLLVSVSALPVTAHAGGSKDTTPPTLTASLEGDALKIESSDDLSGVEAVFVDENRINSLTDGKASVALKDYAGTEKQVSIYAKDYAGNRSDVVKLDNPYYKEPAPEKKPAVAAPQSPSGTQTKPPKEEKPSGSNAATPSGGGNSSGSDNSTGQQENTSAVPEGAFTPEGTGTVQDNISGTDGEKQFYTITTDAGNVFYLVIDGKREDNNVYFLNGVTESDLMALAEKNNGSMSMIPQEESCNCTEKCEAGKVNTGCPVCKNDLSGCKGKEKPTETEKPAEPEKPKKETGSVGTILFILAALLAVGGIGYYVKIVRPKQQAEDDAEFEDDGYGEGFDPDEAYGEPEYLSEDDFDDKDSK